MKKWKKVVWITVGVLAALAVLVAGLMLWSRNYRSDPSSVRDIATDNVYITGETEVSAHRSGGGIMPEETMMAFKNCIRPDEFSIDIFEFDLHITKDNVLVLLHDDTLDRTSDCETVFGETEVRPEEKTYAQLRLLNMGAKFVTDDGQTPYAHLSGDAVPDDLRIVRLEDILDFLNSKGEFKYIIEVKNGEELGKTAVDELYRILKERDMVDKVAFGTFHEEISAYVDEAYPLLARSTSIKEVMEFWIAALTDSKSYQPPCRILQIPFCDPYLGYGVNLGTAKVVNYAHEHNMAVQYWTINDEEDMKYLASIGADCIMSDYPDKLYSVLHS